MAKPLTFTQKIRNVFRRGVYYMPEQNYIDTVTGNPEINYGVTVDNDTAMKFTALYAGIRIRSENIASFPKSVKVATPNGLQDAPNHPVSKLISDSPNNYTNKFDFWNTTNALLDGWGNAYAVIERDKAGVPIALHQVHPSRVEISFVNKREYYTVNVLNSDFAWLNGTYPAEDMLHFMLVTFDGIKGVNPIVYNATAIGKGLATQKFGAEFYNKGGNIKAVLETDGSLGDEAYNQFVTHYKKSATNFETPLLEYGIKYKEVGISPISAQLIQSETLSVQDVCRIINIPPHMLAELSHATFSNIEHQTIQFVQYALRPTVKRLEVELERKLFTSAERGKYSVKFELDGLLRGDTAARSAYYHNAILDGYMSRNEVRALENLDKADGLDDYIYPMNYNIVGKEAEQASSSASKSIKNGKNKQQTV